MKGLLRLAPLLLLLSFGAAGAAVSESAWLHPTLMHPLGTDEFGRDVTLVLLISVGRSLASALTLAGLGLFISATIAVAVALLHVRVLSILLQIANQIIESIPVFVWVLVTFAALKGASMLAVGVTFVIALMPTLTTIIAGEFRRLDQEPFLEAAKLLGAGLVRRLLRHILPNAAGALMPLFVQTLGIAFAIKGAIGLLGFSNRTDYDVGMILLRGARKFRGPSTVDGVGNYCDCTHLHISRLDQGRVPARGLRRGCLHAS